jgi:sphingomyelin phosphodiesterase
MLSSTLIADSRNIGYFLLYTDQHHDNRYKEGSPANCFLGSTGLGCCREDDIPIKPEHNAGKYGDYNCDTPKIAVNLTLKWFSDFGTYDAIFWGGDSAGHHDLTQSISENMGAVKTVTDFIQMYYPNTPVFPCIGNHDTWPIDQLGQPPLDEGITGDIASYWKQWLPTDQYEQFKRGGFYSKLFRPGLRIVVLDSLFFDRNNLLDRVGSVEPNEQWEWLNKTLDASRTANESVWVFGHIPPGTGEATKNFTEQFIIVNHAYQDVIKYHLWGHTHHDQILLLSYQGKIFSSGNVGPSAMFNHQFGAVMKFYYDRDTFEIIDYEQYAINLTAINEGKPFTFTKQYSALKEYELKDLSVNSMVDIYNRMKKNNTLADVYCSHFNPGMNHTCSENGAIGDILVSYQ